MEIKGLDRLSFEEAAARFGRGESSASRWAKRLENPDAPGAGLRQRRVLAASSVMLGSILTHVGRNARSGSDAVSAAHFFSPGGGGAPPLQKKNA